MNVEVLRGELQRASVREIAALAIQIRLLHSFILRHSLLDIRYSSAAQQKLQQ
jgi:hypothetical protein